VGKPQKLPAGKPQELALTTGAPRPIRVSCPCSSSKVNIVCLENSLLRVEDICAQEGQLRLGKKVKIQDAKEIQYPTMLRAWCGHDEVYKASWKGRLYGTWI